VSASLANAFALAAGRVPTAPLLFPARSVPVRLAAVAVSVLTISVCARRVLRAPLAKSPHALTATLTRVYASPTSVSARLVSLVLTARPLLAALATALHMVFASKVFALALLTLLAKPVKSLWPLGPLVLLILHALRHAVVTVSAMRVSVSALPASLVLTAPSSSLPLVPLTAMAVVFARLVAASAVLVSTALPVKLNLHALRVARRMVSVFLASASACPALVALIALLAVARKWTSSQSMVSA